jgi:four helix bundle protein
MKTRTKRRVIKAVQALANDRVANVLGSQLLRAGTSVGANYRAACRAKSTADFVNKLKIVEEECDESLYRMELTVESGLMRFKRLTELMTDGRRDFLHRSRIIEAHPLHVRLVNRKS